MSNRTVKQFNVYLPVETIREVKHLAVETEQSVSAIVEAALTEYLQRHQRGRKAAPRGNRRI
jgi:hypothetical protein